MSHFDGKTWLRHDPEEGVVCVHLIDGPVASLDIQAQTFVQKDGKWRDSEGNEIDDVLLIDDLDVLTGEVDLATEG